MSGPLAFDRTYLKTRSFLLKLVCLWCCVFGSLCTLSSSVHYHNARGLFYNTVALLAFTCTTLLLLTWLFQVWQRKWPGFSALKYEAFVNAFLAVTFFVAGGVALSLNVLAYSLAAFFGLFAFLFYGFDAWLAYKASRLNEATTQTVNV